MGVAASELVPAQSQQPTQTIFLPDLIWRNSHALGDVEHVFRDAGSVSVLHEKLVKVSARKSETLLVLASGESVVLTERRNCPRPADADGVLYRSDAGALSWISHRFTDGGSDEHSWRTLHEGVSTSWAVGIRYVTERVDSANHIVAPGLRPPQIGALHAIGSHWSLHRRPATVVMPTGTGKTETMIAALVGEVRGALLVVVPSSALRTQTVRKFKTLGLLRELGVIGNDVRNPIVGLLRKRPRTEADLDIFKRCHVVIATMAALSQGTATGLGTLLAAAVDTLIVDEAHHIGAKSWRAFREHFAGARVLQFTATPFRRDGELVDGDPIYTYPLRRAQQDGYFKPIRFDPVCEVDTTDGDEAIAAKATDLLKKDLSAGLDHLVMARCETIDRAASVHAIYERLAPEQSPVLVHSDDSSASYRVDALLHRKSRIVVCVDMLGEGFDLPQLKIAAIHDTHKSLAVLLQFAGRFTRQGPANVGDATAIANIADQQVSQALERLYSEDADWNYLLAELSSQAIREHRELVEFLTESVPLHDDAAEEPILSISPSLLRPMFSAVVYRTAAFHPRRFHQGLPKGVEIHRVWLHQQSQTLYFVTRAEEPVRWTRSKQLRDRQWNLFILHYDPQLGVLFLHSSDKSSLHETLAKAVSDDPCTLIRGDSVFRTLAHITRLRFHNLGITKHARRNIRYAMYTGADVKQALSISQTAGSTKSNLSATGFEEGQPVAVGCSYKGRIWSREQGPIRRFTRWCKHAGAKLLDASIDTKGIIDNVMIPDEVDRFPDSIVLSLEWPIELLHKPEERLVLKHSSGEEPLSLFELVCDGVSDDNRNMAFHVESEHVRCDFLFRLGVSGGFSIEHVSGAPLQLIFGRLDVPFHSYLSDYPPLVRFVDLSELDGNLLVRPQEAPDLTFPAELFEPWEWTGVDVTKESLWKQGELRPESIQARAAQHFIDGGFDVVFDDDAAGEAADLVCLKNEDDHIRLTLVHCKFAKAPAGERVKDVVEVCSQAVRSGRWIWNFRGLCRHVTTREQRLRSPERPSRFLHGDLRKMGRLLQASRFTEVRAEVLIVQPGFSVANQTPDQVMVLAAAHNFLKDTVGVSLDVICSA